MQKSIKNFKIPKGKILLEIIFGRVDFCVRNYFFGWKIQKDVDSYGNDYEFLWFDWSVSTKEIH